MDKKTDQKNSDIFKYTYWIDNKVIFDSSKLKTLSESLEQFKDVDFKFLNSKLPPTRKSTPETAVKHLQTAFNDGNLTLVLGAGISMKYGIPKWDELLQRLLLKTIEQKPDKAVALSKFFSKIFNPTPIIAGRYLQTAFSDKKNLNQFEKEVRQALYQTFDELEKSETVDEILQFCAAPGNTPNLDSIISYNYDDIIESKLKNSLYEIPFQTIYGQGINPDNKTLPIYHVHGYLPKIGIIGDENAITLGEHIYHKQYNNIYSWNNIVQINKFRDKTCLFIGTSLTDPNTRRLLDIANSQKRSNKFHYIFKKRPNENWISDQIIDLLKENDDSRDKKMDEKEIKETVNFLIKMQNRFEEKDSESLGVKTVWIDDFDVDIPKILKKIRNQNVT